MTQKLATKKELKSIFGVPYRLLVPTNLGRSAMPSSSRSSILLIALMAAAATLCAGSAHAQFAGNTLQAKWSFTTQACMRQGGTCANVATFPIDSHVYFGTRGTIFDYRRSGGGTESKLNQPVPDMIGRETYLATWRMSGNRATYTAAFPTYQVVLNIVAAGGACTGSASMTTPASWPADRMAVARMQMEYCRVLPGRSER